MEINFNFNVSCDKEHLKKLQHLLIDEEYDEILDILASEKEYEIKDFKGEVVDNNKNNVLTIPYKQDDYTITIPKTIPCDGSAPLNGIDHLYRPDQVVYETCNEPAENVLKLYTESNIYSAEGSSDLPDDVNINSTPDDFHYSMPITTEELEKVKDITEKTAETFNNIMKMVEFTDEKNHIFEFAESAKNGSIQCSTIEAVNLAEAIRWYESTNNVELVYCDIIDEYHAESIKLLDDVVRIVIEGTCYFFRKRSPQFYYVIKNDHNLFYTTIKSDLTGKDIITFIDSIEKADHFEFIQSAKNVIDHNKDCQDKDFTIIKCAKRIAEIYCGEGRIIKFNEWHYKCEGNKDDRSRNNNEDEG